MIVVVVVVFVIAVIPNISHEVVHIHGSHLIMIDTFIVIVDIFFLLVVKGQNPGFVRQASVKSASAARGLKIAQGVNGRFTDQMSCIDIHPGIINWNVSQWSLQLWLLLLEEASIGRPD